METLVFRVKRNWDKDWMKIFETSSQLGGEWLTEYLKKASAKEEGTGRIEIRNMDEKATAAAPRKRILAGCTFFLSFPPISLRAAGSSCQALQKCVYNFMGLWFFFSDSGASTHMPLCQQVNACHTQSPRDHLVFDFDLFYTPIFKKSFVLDRETHFSTAISSTFRSINKRKSIDWRFVWKWKQKKNSKKVNKCWNW